LQQVTFIIEGKTISGNHYKNPSQRGNSKKKKFYVVKEATSFKELVKLIALDAVFRSKYEIPEYCRMDVSLYHNRQDRENAVKVFHDALEGVIYTKDSRILDGAIRKVKDYKGVNRTIATATEVLDAWYGYPNPKKTHTILSHEDWVASMLEPYDFSALL